MASVLAQQPALPTTKLSAGIYVIQAEVASTTATRSQGLMQRKSMAQGAGMLFLFDESAGHCMWMKNTLIRLYRRARRDRQYRRHAASGRGHALRLAPGALRAGDESGLV
jgi:hypothetical protein